MAGQTPSISYPDCALSYQPKPNQRTQVAVRYQVRDVRTNGQRYTSPVREFVLTIDSRTNQRPVLAPIYQLLLGNEDES